jgi:hypothetical protein
LERIGFYRTGKGYGRRGPKPFGQALGLARIKSTLIFGEYDAALVDSMMRSLRPRLLQIWVALRKLRFRETDSISERRTK